MYRTRGWPVLALAFTFLISFHPAQIFVAGYICNGSIAQPGPPYISAYPPGATTVSHPPSGPTKTALPADVPSATGTFDWNQAGIDAVNDIGGLGKVRRDGDDEEKVFECPYFQTCLLDGGGVDTSGNVINGGRLFCYEPYNGNAEYRDGYTLSLSTGTYYTPEDEKGNLVKGPCPGKLYEENPSGGCRRVKASSNEGAEATPTSAKSSGSVASATADAGSAASQAAGSSGTNLLDGDSGRLWGLIGFAVLSVAVVV